MINFNKELKKRGIKKTAAALDLEISEPSVTAQLGTMDKPKELKKINKYAYAGYFVDLEAKKHDITLNELAGIEETNVTHRFREFLGNNSKTK